MVASDYRLEQVTARLIERLEGTRRSFVDDPAAGKAAFVRIAQEHVEAAIGEYREVGLDDDPEPQAELLRREVLETFLPRYTRIALAMNQSEARRFGFGWLGSPLGRVAFGALALILLFATFRLPGLRGMGWTLLPLLLPLPIAPDIVGLFVRGRHRRQLQAIVGDMEVIQEQATAYLPPERLKLADDAEPRRRPVPNRQETP